MAAFHLIIYGRFWVITEDLPPALGNRCGDSHITTASTTTDINSTQNPKNQDQRNDAQYHYPGGPNQMIKVGHAGIANSNELTPPDLAAREHLEDALDRFNEAIDRFHEERSAKLHRLCRVR